MKSNNYQESEDNFREPSETYELVKKVLYTLYKERNDICKILKCLIMELFYSYLFCLIITLFGVLLAFIFYFIINFNDINSFLLMNLSKIVFLFKYFY
jgi:hypothetical protein